MTWAGTAPRRGLLLAALALLAGCAAPPAPPAAGAWSGRLALTLASDPPQRWSAGFELTGGPRRGELRLTGPLGQTVAALRWDGPAAWLDRGDGQPRQFDSIEALTTELTGAALPIDALFAWLDGVSQAVPGWQVDLSGQPQGRLRAERTTPPPSADLRLIWQPR